MDTLYRLRRHGKGAYGRTRALSCALLCAALLVAMSSSSFAAVPTTRDGIDWYEASQWGVSGKAWDETEGPYDRLPAKAKSEVPAAVWNLSKQSAGMYVEFETDARTIHARWYLTLSRLALPHMAATGASGLDLYVQDGSGTWRWLATPQPDVLPSPTKQLITGLPAGNRRYRLYLPLYNGVRSLEIGVPHGASFTPIAPSDEKPIVFYGTSITQGAVASRPGMAYTHILGRRLDMPIVNLGFSGAGKMEPALAHLLAEIDAAVYVLDAFPNMDSSLISSNFYTFVRILHEARPDTPIIVVEDREYANTAFQPTRQTHYQSTRLVIRRLYDRLVDSGIDNLTFVPRDNLFGDDFEATVDGSHPTDLGMVRYSDILEPVLREALGK